MAEIKNSERRLIEATLISQPGFVLDFTNRTFREFFEDELKINIYSDEYSGEGDSKANRLRCFLRKASQRNAGKILRALWNYYADLRSREIFTELAEFATTLGNPHPVELAQDQLQQEQRVFLGTVEKIEQRADSQSITTAKALAEFYDLDTVVDDIERARAFIKDDPEDAITAACSLIESVMRSILIELNEELPKELTVARLYKSVRGPLLLIPDDKSDVGVRKSLAALGNLIDGMGTLRTQAGDAHGREKGVKRVDERIARLAVDSAASLSIFLIETWQKHFPSRVLPNDDAVP